MAEAPSGNTLAPAKIWEVDFCSRPLLDDRGKKVWELLITDADRKLQYSEFFPNNKINSQEARQSPLLSRGSRQSVLTSISAQPAWTARARD